MEPIYVGLADFLKLPLDQVAFIFHLFYIIPLGMINYFIKNPQSRMIYGMVSGIFLCYNLYGYKIYHLFIDAVITHYFISNYGRKLSAFWILIVTLIHISYIHISRMIEDFGGWNLDVSTIYMMSVVKFSAMAFSYEDGEKPDDKIESVYLREKKIVDKPTLLESFSFFFHFSSCIVGPSIEFSDYKKFIYLSNEYSELNFSNIVINSSKSLGSWLIYTGIFLVGNGYFPISYVITEQFGEHNFLYKFFYIYASGNILRAMYYSGWKLAHTSMSFTGLTYSQVKSKDNLLSEDYNKAICFDYWGVEIEPNAKKKITKWNITVHLWLKYSVYIRFKNKENLSNFLNSISPSLNFISRISPELITFMVSAFWHGFYPNYYIFFFTCYMVEQICSFLDDKTYYFDFVNKLYEKSLVHRVLYFVIGIIHLNFLNFCGLFFQMLTFDKLWMITKNTSGFYWVGLLLAFAIGKFIPRTKEKRDRTNTSKTTSNVSNNSNKVE